MARVGQRRGAYKILVGKPEGKKLLGRPKHRLENNIKMDLQDVGWGHELGTGLIRFRIETGGSLL